MGYSFEYQLFLKSVACKSTSKNYSYGCVKSLTIASKLNWKSSYYIYIVRCLPGGHLVRANHYTKAAMYIPTKSRAKIYVVEEGARCLGEGVVVGRVPVGAPCRHAEGSVSRRLEFRDRSLNL